MDNGASLVSPGQGRHELVRSALHMLANRRVTIERLADVHEYLCMQGLPGRKVAPELCYPDVAAAQSADISRQHSSEISTTTNAGTPPGMSVDLGLGPAGAGCAAALSLRGMLGMLPVASH